MRETRRTSMQIISWVKSAPGSALNRVIDSVTLKFSYEKLSGKGGADRFVTILGTNHAFQG